MAVFNQGINQQLLNQVGFTGTAGGGAGDAWLAQNPAAAAKYTQLRGTYQPGYTFNNPNAQPLNSYGGGVAPVGFVEPLNDYQKAALTARGESGAPGMGYMSGAADSFKRMLAGIPNASNLFSSGNEFYNQATGYLGDAAAGIRSGTQGLTDASFREGYNRYSNPFIEDVIGGVGSDLNREADFLRRDSKRAGSMNGAFGGTASGVEMGEIGRNVLDRLGKYSSELRAQNFNQATGNALNQFNTERNRDLSGASANQQGAQIAGGFGADRFNQGFNSLTQLQNATQLGLAGNQANRQKFLDNTEAQMGAGNFVQNQNQKLLDILSGQITGKTNYSTDSLNRLASYLGAIPQGMYTSQSGSSSSGGGGGGIGKALGGLATLFSGFG
jgi:hypothetical protein